MKKTMMYLPDSLHRYLVDEAARQSTSMAQIAREAIAEYQSRKETPHSRDLSALIGALDELGPPSTDALNVDAHLGAHFASGGSWDEEHGHASTD